VSGLSPGWTVPRGRPQSVRRFSNLPHNASKRAIFIATSGPRASARHARVLSRSFASGLAVCEREALDMAGGAGLGAIGRHSPVIEKMAAQLDFSGGHGVVGGNTGFGESRREVPLIGGLGKC
jgi:hypothetical protein